MSRTTRMPRVQLRRQIPVANCRDLISRQSRHLSGANDRHQRREQCQIKNVTPIEAQLVIRGGKDVMCTVSMLLWHAEGRALGPA